MSRSSKQQKAVFNVLKTTNQSLKPQEILQIAQKNIPTLGIATVYRDIKSYLETKKIMQIDIPGSSPRYEVKDSQHHHHFFCRICQSVFKVNGCPGKLNFSAPKGFKTEDHDIILKGLCFNCQG